MIFYFLNIFFIFFNLLSSNSLVFVILKDENFLNTKKKRKYIIDAPKIAKDPNFIKSLIEKETVFP